VVKRVRAGTGRSRVSLYTLERVTPFFQWCADHLQAEVVGSEYLGSEHTGGRVVGDVRHEDVTRLSFADASFDLVVSNDVHEHVPDPVGGLRELARVLKPGGTLLMSVPFNPRAETSTVRARIENGRVRGVRPPVFHGNPISKEGSLVFTDFGWDFLGWMKSSGFASAELERFWSLEYGYLGLCTHIRAVREGGRSRAQ
jgi:SAM-dependent methyltransferase